MTREYIYFVDDNPNGTSGMTEEEIVRCKDCRYQAKPLNDVITPCEHCSGLMNAKDENFCSYGERRTGK